MSGSGIGATVARLLGVLACTTMLAGCYTTEGGLGVAGVVPSDVRQRHPIAIREGAHSVELFIGSKRGGLSGEQRADVEIVQALAGRIPGMRGIYAGRLRNAHQVEALVANLISVNRRYKAHAGLRVTDV